MKYSFAVLLSFVFLMACSQQKLAMRFADTAAVWTADDYFDLNSAQKERLKKDFKTYLKKTYEANSKEIPQIFADANTQLALVSNENNINCSETQKITTRAVAHWQSLGPTIAQDLTPLFESLSPKQIEHFVEQVAEKVEENKTKKREPKKRIERNLEQTENFFGGLSADQKLAIRQHLESNPYPFEAQLANQSKNLEKLKAAVLSKETFQAFALEYIRDWRKFQSEDFLKLHDGWRAKNIEFYQGFACSASTKQLQHLRRKLGDLQRDFETQFILK